MHCPKASIIVPVYNVEDYLEECLRSLLIQTLQDIEIVCIDDGSTDDSSRILDDVASQDDRIVPMHIENHGVAHARNEGLKAANGEYCMFVDSDDYIFYRTCELTVKVAEENDADIVVFGGKSFPSHEWADWTFATRNKIYKNKGIDALLFERGAMPLMCNKLYKRSFLIEQDASFCEELVLGEDNAFQFTVFPAAKTIVFMEENFYFYRIRTDSAVGSSLRDYNRRLRLHLEVVKHVYSVWKERRYVEGRLTDLVAWSITFLYDEALSASFNTRATVSREFTELLADYTSNFSNESLKLDEWIQGKLDYLVEAQHALDERPLISVLLSDIACVGESSKAIENLLCQTIQNIQIIVSGVFASPEDLDKASDYVSDDRRFCIIEGKDARSLAAAIEGRYVIFVSSYTVLSKTAFRDLLECAGLLTPPNRIASDSNSCPYVVDAVIGMDSSNIIEVKSVFDYVAPDPTADFISNDYMRSQDYLGYQAEALSFCAFNKMISTEIIKKVLNDHPNISSMDSISTLAIFEKCSFRILGFPFFSFSTFKSDSYRNYVIETLGSATFVEKQIGGNDDAKSLHIFSAAIRLLIAYYPLLMSKELQKAWFKDLAATMKTTYLESSFMNRSSKGNEFDKTISLLCNKDVSGFDSMLNDRYLSALLVDSAENASRIHSDSHEIGRLNMVIQDFGNSISFKVGRMVTLLPRKLKILINRYR